METSIIFDLEGESGIEEIMVHTTDAREFLERGRGRYVQTLPLGAKVGPRQGFDRVVLV